MSKAIRVSVRPGVETVFVSARQNSRGTLLECRGTQEQLLAAGVAQPYMFENMSKSGYRSRGDEFGDHYIIKRRPKGVWELTLRHGHEPAYEDVTDQRARKRKWYPKTKANVDRIVQKIIAQAGGSRGHGFPAKIGPTR